MDDARYRIREFEEKDYPAEARLHNQINPDDPATAEEIRHWVESLAAPGLVRRQFVVEDHVSGAVVASGDLTQVPFNYHPRKFWISVRVDPDHRRRGIGQKLYNFAERAATEHGAIALWSSVRAEDPLSIRFLLRQGFVEQRRVWVSRLELARANLSALPDRSAAFAAEGIRFSTLALEGPDRPEVRERYYRVWDTSGQDVPIVGQHTSVPFEQFVRFEFESPYFRPEAVFLALHGDDYVGVTVNAVPPADPQTLRVGYTGVLRAYRGRGVATELKRRAIEYARAQGFRYMRTGNDSLNAPIWAINERLGFLRQRTWVNAEKTLESPAESGRRGKENGSGKRVGDGAPSGPPRSGRPE
jgi:mycothiol synthase